MTVKIIMPYRRLLTLGSFAYFGWNLLTLDGICLLSIYLLSICLLWVVSIY
jgi:hypothetical protein